VGELGERTYLESTTRCADPAARLARLSADSIRSAASECFVNCEAKAWWDDPGRATARARRGGRRLSTFARRFSRSGGFGACVVCRGVELPAAPRTWRRISVARIVTMLHVPEGAGQVWRSAVAGCLWVALSEEPEPGQY